MTNTDTDVLLIEDQIKNIGRKKIVFVDEPPAIVLNDKGSRITKVNIREIERMAELLYSRAEVAKALHISLSTMEHNPKAVEAYKSGQVKAYHALETAAYKNALDGNPQVQIFLLKNYLNFSDKIRMEQANVTILIQGDDCDL